MRAPACDSRSTTRGLRGGPFRYFGVFAVLGALTGGPMDMDAAAPGLPLAETFDDAVLRDGVLTTADWSTRESAVILPRAARIYGALTASTSASSDVGTISDATTSLVLGDMDGDGDLDVVVGNNGQRNLLYLNDGSADPFLSIPPTPISQELNDTEKVVVSDIDSDGDLDVVTANTSGQFSRLYLNNGTVDPFADVDGVDLPFVGARSTGLAVGDLNGDGHPDLVFGNDFDERNRMLLNNGTSDPFAGVTSVIVSPAVNSTKAVALADVDNDGDLDLAVANARALSVVYLNNGSSTPFAGSPGLPLGATITDTTDIRFADVNGDGLVDALTAEFNRSNQFFLNNGTATPFGDPGGNLGTELDSTFEIAAGDIDNDGDLDVVASNDSPQLDRFLQNFGTSGLFSPPQGGQTANAISLDVLSGRSVALGDVDRDGDLDVVIGNFGQVNRVHFNGADLNPFNGVTGRGLNRDSVPVPVPDFSDSRDVVVGDVNGDQLVDIIIANQSEDIAVNGGFETGDFTGWTRVASANGDFEINDGSLNPPGPDGPLPPFAGNFSGLAVQSNAGEHLIYQEVVMPPVGFAGATLCWAHRVRSHGALGANQSFRVEVRSADGMDTVLATLFTTIPADPALQGWTLHSTDISAFIGNTIRLAFIVNPGDQPLNVHLDNVRVEVTQSPSQVYLNQSGGFGGGFAAGVALPFVGDRIELGDIDKDGDLDLGVAQSQCAVAQILLNDGSGGFGTPILFDQVPNSATSAIAMGDMDSDGDVDVVLGFDGVNVMYFNRFNDSGGTDTFMPGDFAIITSDSHPTSDIIVEDVDGDGDLDVIAGNGDVLGSGARNRLYLNNGTADPFAGIAGSDITSDADATVSLALGDIDRDGDLDLIAGNIQGFNKTYVNDGTTSPFPITGGGVAIGAEFLDTHDVALVDLDRDGDLELLTANHGFGVPNHFYLNAGGADPYGGGVAREIHPDGQVFSGVALASGDLDRDGDPDLVVANGFQVFEGNRFYLNIDTPTLFGNNAIGHDVTMDTHITMDVVTGDIDGDGDIDAIAGNLGVPNRLYLNNGSGDPFETVMGVDVTGDANATQTLELADIDGDGDLDLIEGNRSQVNRIYLNNGTADPFDGVSGIDLGVDATSAVGLAVGDYDCDGDLDLVVANSDGPLLLYFNNGSGDPFAAATPSVLIDFPMLGLTPSDVAMGDITGDLYPDIVVGVRGEVNVLLENNANGGVATILSLGIDFFGGDNTSAIALADLDLDGNIDVVEAVDGGINQIWLNTGVGGASAFGESPYFDNFGGDNLGFDASRTMDIAILDVNLDGAMDIVAGNGTTFLPEQNLLYLSGGVISPFAGSVGMPYSSETLASSAIAVAEMNGDGLPDVFEGNGDDTAGAVNRFFSRKSFSVRPAIANSVRVDTETSNITAARLTPTEIVPPNTSVDYFLSNNGGARYFKVVEGRQFIFPTVGTDLRWRAELRSLAPQTTPRVDQVDITGPAQNVAPVLSDIDLTVVEDLFRDFTASDFADVFVDADEDVIQFVRIANLPPNGDLTLNGEPVGLGQQVLLADLSGMRYQPHPQFNGMDTFVWNAFDGTAFAAVDVNVNFTVTPVADTPSVTEASTDEDVQTFSGLRISPAIGDGPEVTHYKITNIQGGDLFQNDGSTPISDGQFITVAQGDTGLRFTPSLNVFSTGLFDVQASISGDDSGLGGGMVRGSIFVEPKSDTPSVTSATALEDTQTTSGLVISRHPDDGVETAFFKITDIQGGSLFENDGVTPIVDGSFVPAAEGLAGLRFTPALNSNMSGSFKVEASLTADDPGIGGDFVTALITVFPVPDTPTISDAATVEDMQTTAGLVIERNPSDDVEVSHFKISGITGGSVFKNDGTTEVTEGNFVTFVEGNAGLRFTPAENSEVNGSFTIRGATAGNNSSLGGPTVLATIVVTPVNDPPVAVPDTYILNQGGRLDSVVNLLDPVLRNDTDVENDPLTAVLISGPMHAAGGETEIVGVGGNVHGQIDPQPVADAVAVAAGGNHSLALKRDGSVVAWGRDSDGQATVPMALSGVIAIAAGESHSLALKNDGTVVAWGDNTDGQTAVPGGLTDVIAISAGHFHNIALKRDRTVVAWGKNLQGEGGVPGGVMDIVAIAAGAKHNLAVTAAGAVMAWGDNSGGQIDVPVMLADVHSVAGGFEHSLALKNDGTVVGWGGLLGEGVPPPGLTGVKEITASLGASLALKEDGTVVGWGVSAAQFTPDGIPGLVAISGGGSHALAVREISPYTFALNSDGAFVYEHDGSETSVDTFTYRADDGTEYGNTETVTFQIGAINGPPIVTVPGAQMVNEDEELLISGTAVADPDSATESLVVNLRVDHGTLGLTSSMNLVLVDGDGSDGRLTFTGSQADITTALQNSITYQGLSNFNGEDTLTVEVNDQGNTGLGPALTDAKTVAITVNPVNDEPSIIAATPPQVFEDALPVTVEDWATFVPGPTDENGQGPVAFTVSNVSDPMAFVQPPAVSNDGDLTYAVSPDYFGSVTFDLSVQDDGLRANGGDDVSQLYMFTITINAVNDRPGFAALDPPASLEDTGLQTVPGWASGFDPGPDNEGGQNPLLYTVSNIEDPSMFTVAPAVSVTGELTYTLAPDAFGTSGFEVVVVDDGGIGNGSENTSLPKPFVITVTGVNDKPAISAMNPPTILEGADEQTIVGWATLLPGVANETADTALAYTVSGFDDVFAVPPTVMPNGDLTFRMSPDVNGAVTFDVRVQDSGGMDAGGVDLSDLQTYTINITPVNDPPTFTVAVAPPSLEDDGEQTVPNWASGFDPGPIDEGGQSKLEYVVSNVQQGFFATAPAVDINGQLTYTPADDVFGMGTFDVQVRDDGGDEDGGIDLSAPLSATVTVTGVNDPPSFTAMDPPAVFEDSGEQTIPGWATFTAGDGNEADGVLTYIVNVVANGALFDVEPTVSVTGELKYTPALNAVGQAMIEVSVQDDGGSGGDNIDTSTVQTFTITVNGVNDAPTFSALSGVQAPEDGGPQTRTAFAKDFVPGPDDESGQMVVRYTVSNVSNPGLFLEPPAVAPNGDLAFTPSANAFGTSTFDLVAQDDGGDENGGVNMSAPRQILVDVFAVNDVPGFVATNPPETVEDSGLQTVSNWAVFSPGGPEEAGQMAFNYNVTVVSNPGMFAPGGAPAVSVGGELNYTLANNENGSAEFDVSVQDDGGSLVVGDVDTSPAQRFTITARPVNDPPSIVAVDPPSVLEDAGGQSVSGWVQMFIPGPPDENGQAPVGYSIGTIGDPGLFTTPPAVDSNGTLTYTPAPNAFGSSTFQVIVQDDGLKADNGEDTSVAQTFVISVTAVNDQPGFAASNPPAVMEDAGMQTLSSWAVFDAGPNESGQRVAQYIISNTTDPSLFSSGPAIDPTSGDLTYTPAPHAHGTSSFTVAVQDDGTTDDGGVDISVTQTFDIVVGSVNDAPVVSVPPTAALIEDSFIEISGGSLSDADADADPLVVTLSVGNGELVLLDEFDATVTDADGSDGSLSFTGSQTTADSVLQAGVRYTPKENFNGEDMLVVQADDQGSTGPDGARMGFANVVITVSPLADTPSVSDSETDEDVQTTSGLVVARNPGDGVETTHMKITAITGGALYQHDGVTPIVDGDFVLADAGAAGLRFTPAENATANGFITVQASTSDNDSGLDGMTVTATITVNSVNDPPEIGLPAPASSDEDGSTVISGITVADADAGENPILMNVSVGHGSISLTSSSGITFTPPNGDDGSDGTLSFSGTQSAITDAFKSSILYTPTPDYDGPDTLTLSANDQGQSGGAPETTTAMLAINVVGENDRPTTIGIPDFTVTLNSMASVINLAAAFDDVEDADADLMFTVLENTNPGLFDSLQIDAVAGTLTLDYAADVPGSSFVSLRCADTGGEMVDVTFRVSVLDIQESEIVAGDAAIADWFGWSVSISGDLMVVGAYRNDDDGEASGAAYVYQRLAGAEDRWHEIRKLTAMGAAAGDEFGRSVAIAGDTIVIGANGDDDLGDRSGSAYVFQKDHGGVDNWGEVARINSSSGAAGDRFGWSVAIHADTIVAGAPRDDDNGADSGAAFVFERDSGGPDQWGQTGALLPGDSGGADYWFGNSVAIHGAAIIVGQPFDQANGADSGSAFVFGRDNGGADQWGQAKKLTAADGASDDWFGWSVSISGDTAAVGAARDDIDAKSNAGSAYVFQRNQDGADQWGQVRKLISSDADAGDAFGFSVSVSGDTVLVGAHNNNDRGDDSGSVYLFGRDQGGVDQWMEAGRLTASDGAAGDVFGYSVAIDADSFAVGAPNSDNPGPDTGSVYMFRIGSTLDLFRAENFSLMDLADPEKEATVWGDQADPDMDGQSNFFEFVAGFDPNSQGSRFEFRIELVPGQPTHRRLIFGPIVAGRTYHVQVNTDLGAGPFVPLTGAMVDDDGSERTVTDLNATGFRTYRVQISVP